MDTNLPTSFANGRFFVEKELGRGAMGIVYQVLDQERDMRVALKTLVNIDKNSLYLFKREFRALNHIVHPNLCSFIELINDNEVWFLTMELVEGVNFLSYVQNQALPKPSFDEQRLRKSLTGLCNGLNALHTAGKVHCDIKPSNVMVNTEDRVVLLDFGLIADKGNLDQSDIGVMIGTAAYMAPEQADPQEIGPAADYYSVGVMLYEVLTGRLPFEGAPMKIILDKQVLDPTRPGEIVPNLPRDLEELCIGLLSKDPNSRPNPADFLPMLDASSAPSLHSPSTLTTAHTLGEIFVGRNEERKLLRESFRQVAGGAFQTVIVEGVSGVGKSALVSQFVNETLAAEPSTIVLDGRCYEHESAPFKAFDGIIESFVRYTKKLSPEEASKLLPPNSDFLVRLFPPLRRSELFADIRTFKTEIDDPYEQRRRSFASFKALLAQLGRQGPLVIVIDDMQWADPDSLNLLSHLLSDDDNPQMLLILSSRFAEGASDSVWDWNELLRGNHTNIRLSTLDNKDSVTLATMYINMQRALLDDIDPHFIAQESDGHPLYIAELIRHISSGETNEWKSLRLDEVILNRVNMLPQPARVVLETVCIAGTPMMAEHLKELSDLQSEEFYKSISLLRTCNLLRSRGPHKDSLVEPYHDRVREAITSHLRESEKIAEIHLGIGRFLINVYSSTEREENIFEIVRHFTQGKRLISDEDELETLCILNLQAGRKARTASAYRTALRYFEESIDLLSEKGKNHSSKIRWRKNYTLSLELHTHMAEMGFFLNEQHLLEEHCDIVARNAKSALDKVDVYEIRIRNAQSRGEVKKAVAISLETLALLGIRLPQIPSKRKVVSELLKTKLLLRKRTDEEILNLPEMTNRRARKIVQISHRAGPSMYFGSKELMAINILIRLRMSLKYGNTPASLSAYSSYGLICCGILRKFDEGYRYGKLSVDLLEQYDLTELKGNILFRFNHFICHWKKPVVNCLEQQLEAYRMCIKAGDIDTAGYPALSYGSIAVVSGRPIGQWLPRIDELVTGLKNVGENHGMHITLIFRQGAVNLTIGFENKTKLQGAFYNEDEMIPVFLKESNNSGLLCVYCMKTILSCIFGEDEEAIVNARNFEKYLDGGTSTYLESCYYFYDLLIHLIAWDKLDAKQKKNAQKRGKKNLKLLQKFAHSCKDNYQNKLILILAETARVNNKTQKAEALYAKAIETSLAAGFLHEAAMASELAARYYLAQNDHAAGLEFLKKAMEYYQAWGATAKVTQMKAVYPVLGQNLSEPAKHRI